MSLFENGKEDVAYLADVSGVAKIHNGAVPGNIPTFGENGVLDDSHKKPSDFATSQDLVRSIDEAVSGILGVMANEYAVSAYNADDWVGSTSYEPGDFCKYMGDGYVCKVGNEDETFNSSKWQKVITAAGISSINKMLDAYEKDGMASLLDLAPEFGQGTSYSIGQMAVVNGSLQVCTVAGTGSGATFTSGKTVEFAIQKRLENFFVPTKLSQLSNDSGYLLGIALDNEFDTSEHGYAIDDTCTHGGMFYKCIRRIMQDTEWDASYWERITFKEYVRLYNNDDSAKRDMTDLGVCGSPSSSSSWFSVDGESLEYGSGGSGGHYWGDQNGIWIEPSSGSYVFHDEGNGISQAFSLGSDFMSFVYGHKIVGYVDTIAKVSQIPNITNKKDKQTAVSDPRAEGNALSFIDTLSQDENGVVSATKKTVQVDNHIDGDSTNPVQNKKVKEALDGKRGILDMSVLGAPTGDNTYFIVESGDSSEVLHWEDNEGAPGWYGAIFISIYGNGYSASNGIEDESFTLGPDYKGTFTLDGVTYTATGYVDTLAKNNETDVKLAGKRELMDLDVYTYSPWFMYSRDDYPGHNVTYDPPVRFDFTSIDVGGTKESGWLSAQIDGSYWLIREDLSAIEYLYKSGDSYAVGSGTNISVSEDRMSITRYEVDWEIDIRRNSIISAKHGENLDVPWTVYIDSTGINYTLNKVSEYSWMYESEGEYKIVLNYSASEVYWDVTTYYWDGSEFQFDTEYNCQGPENATSLEFGSGWGSATRSIDYTYSLAIDQELTRKFSGKVDKSAFRAFDDLTLGDNATQADIKTMVQSILQKLKALASCVVAAFLASNILAADSSTTWENMSPTQNVSEVVEQFTPVPEPKTYAMFIIPMNDAFPTNQYLDIELKASTNNFSDSAAPSERLVYYCHTSITNMTGFDDFILFAENQEGHDPRSYTRIGLSSDLEDEPVNRYVLIVSTNCCKRTDGRWLYENNEEIVWTYARTGYINGVNGGREEGNAWAWRPIAPVKWFNKLPKWAEQQ